MVLYKSKEVKINNLSLILSDGQRNWNKNQNYEAE